MFYGTLNESVFFYVFFPGLQVPSEKVFGVGLEGPITF